MNTTRRIFSALPLLTAGALALSGCNLTQTAPMPVAGAALHGSIHGGQQPISGVQIQLYAASNSGYGVGAAYAQGTSLLGTMSVITDSNGTFDITNDYTCPSSTTQVYLVGTGGNPGLGGQVNNPAIALMAALGPCGQLNSQTFLSVNEITTVASVWALSPFMSSIEGVGTSGPSSTSTGNFTGLVNAFQSVNKLANIATGAASGPALPPTALAPTANIATIADILAACVNTSGPAGNGSPCDTLFANTMVNGVAPTDTITAALNMAQHPTANVTKLITLATPSSPFQPTANPTDFSLVIRYGGGGLSAPSGIAVDTAGNIWVPNAAANSVTKLDALGVTPNDATGFLSGATGFTAGQLATPSAIAVDLSGNAWVTNRGNSSVSQIDASGSSATIYSGGGLNAPASVAIDASGNVWVANSASITAISSSGSMSTYGSVGVTAPSAIAINPK